MANKAPNVPQPKANYQLFNILSGLQRLMHEVESVEDTKQQPHRSNYIPIWFFMLTPARAMLNLVSDERFVEFVRSFPSILSEQSFAERFFSIDGVDLGSFKEDVSSLCKYPFSNPDIGFSYKPDMWLNHQRIIQVAKILASIGQDVSDQNADLLRLFLDNFEASGRETLKVLIQSFIFNLI